jgi:mRNA interferase MazF
MQFGQVFNIIFPSDRTGSEVHGKGEPASRPCVIISNNILNHNLNTVTIAPLTSKVKNYPWRTKVFFKGKNGEVMTDQVMTVDKQRLDNYMGTLQSAEVDDLKNKLKTVFN